MHTSYACKCPGRAIYFRCSDTTKISDLKYDDNIIIIIPLCTMNNSKNIMILYCSPNDSMTRRVGIKSNVETS